MPEFRPTTISVESILNQASATVREATRCVDVLERTAAAERAERAAKWGRRTARADDGASEGEAEPSAAGAARLARRAY